MLKVSEPSKVSIYTVYLDHIPDSFSNTELQVKSGWQVIYWIDISPENNPNLQQNTVSKS